MNTLKAVFLLASAVVAGVTLAACREEEQGRILNYEKGVYLGKADAPVSETARRAQRERMRLQGGLTGIDRGGAAPPDVRPPAASPASLEQLRRRGEGQRFN